MARFLSATKTEQNMSAGWLTPEAASLWMLEYRIIQAHWDVTLDSLLDQCSPKRDMEGEREGGGERERHQAQNVLLIRVSSQRSWDPGCARLTSYSTPALQLMRFTLISQQN